MTESETDGSGRYEPQWLEYKKRRALFVFVFLGYGALVALISYLTQNQSYNHNLTNILGLSWFLFMIVAIGRLQIWHCPRCGERYFMKSFWHNLFASRCLHCGLEKYEGS